MVRNGILVILFAVPFVLAQEKAVDGTAASAKGVYVVAFRTPAHVRTSSPEVFHTASAEVRKILTDGKVRIVEDKERGFIENESQMSVASMAKLAGEAGAGSLLFVTVDRPTSKWIKLVLQAYDLDAKLLWEEIIDSGMSAMSGASGYKKCFEKLKKKLPARIGGPGLPVSAN
jgi:hypothetical protein